MEIDGTPQPENPPKEAPLPSVGTLKRSHWQCIDNYTSQLLVKRKGNLGRHLEHCGPLNGNDQIVMSIKST